MTCETICWKIGIGASGRMLKCMCRPRVYQLCSTLKQPELEVKPLHPGLEDSAGALLPSPKRLQNRFWSPLGDGNKAPGEALRTPGVRRVWDSGSVRP